METANTRGHDLRNDESDKFFSWVSTLVMIVCFSMFVCMRACVPMRESVLSVPSSVTVVWEIIGNFVNAATKLCLADFLLDRFIRRKWL